MFQYREGFHWAIKELTDGADPEKIEACLCFDNNCDHFDRGVLYAIRCWSEL